MASFKTHDCEAGQALWHSGIKPHLWKLEHHSPVRDSIASEMFEGPLLLFVASCMTFRPSCCAARRKIGNIEAPHRLRASTKPLYQSPLRGPSQADFKVLTSHHRLSAPTQLLHQSPFQALAGRTKAPLSKPLTG
eukprot:842922-Pelagomonas_calceolata.AAC.4